MYSEYLQHEGCQVSRLRLLEQFEKRISFIWVPLLGETLPQSRKLSYLDEICTFTEVCTSQSDVLRYFRIKLFLGYSNILNTDWFPFAFVDDFSPESVALCRDFILLLPLLPASVFLT